MDPPEQSHHQVFIVHHGWKDGRRVDCMKNIAKKIRKRLQQPPMVSAFVDDVDLPQGGNTDILLSQKLFGCDVRATSTSGLHLMQQGFLHLSISTSHVRSSPTVTRPQCSRLTGKGLFSQASAQHCWRSSPPFTASCILIPRYGLHSKASGKLLHVFVSHGMARLL
jgi:hypothetical protein